MGRQVQAETILQHSTEFIETLEGRQEKTYLAQVKEGMEKTVLRRIFTLLSALSDHRNLGLLRGETRIYVCVS